MVQYDIRVNVTAKQEHVPEVETKSRYKRASKGYHPDTTIQRHSKKDQNRPHPICGILIELYS